MKKPCIAANPSDANAYSSFALTVKQHHVYLLVRVCNGKERKAKSLWDYKGTIQKNWTEARWERGGELGR